MATQTTYLTEQRTALEGMIGNTEPNNLISREVETAAVGFGKAVKQGTADTGVAAADTVGDVIRGITVRDQSVEADSPNQYAVKDSALVMTRGLVWVTAYDTVVAGAPVYVAVNNTSDKFTDTTTSNLAVPNAIFETSGAADELVLVRLLG